jgi:hypothetical protein
MQVDRNTPIKIHKLDAHGHEQWRYDGIVLEQDDSGITLEAYFDREGVEFEGIQLQPGDRFVETFYFDRWYNVFAIYDRGKPSLRGGPRAGPDRIPRSNIPGG